MFKYLDSDKRKLLVKSFFNSQFQYCPLIWMFHGRQVNNKINHLHERVLRMIYEDETSSLKELRERDSSLTVHENNVKLLMIEMYKITHNLTSNSIENLFAFSTHTNYLRSQSDYLLPQIRTEYFGKNSIRYLGPVIWNSLPIDLRRVNSLSTFKSLISTWKPLNCPCRLCKDYIVNLGFL